MNSQYGWMQLQIRIPAANLFRNKFYCVANLLVQLAFFYRDLHDHD